MTFQSIKSSAGTRVSESIQNRATSQSAAWLLIAALFGPIIPNIPQYMYSPPSTEFMAFMAVILGMLLLFSGSDKVKEHSLASKLITQPKNLEQFLSKFGVVIGGFAEAVDVAVGTLRESQEG